MAWVGETAFDARFYFRNVESKAVDLAFELEGGAALWIERLTVHHAADTMIREFGHAVVIANPSRHRETFDLATLIPGCGLRRLRGSSRQDTRANNGQPVTGSVTLGERDALFLVKE